MVEGLHRRLKDALWTRGANATWAPELPWVLLGLRSQPREDSNISPAQAVYGTPLVLPNQYLSIDLRLRAAAHTSLQRPLCGHPAQSALLPARDGRQGGQGFDLPPQALQLQHADSVPAYPRMPPAAPPHRPAAAAEPQAPTGPLQPHPTTISGHMLWTRFSCPAWQVF